MQTIPGLVPALQVGSFEGGQFSANGQATTNNLFLVDGQYDNDSRLGGSQGTQARVTLDTMAEYQVQTHQYGAEYGGSTGVVVNAVTKSGTNNFAGRVFEYFQNNKLQATDYFLKQAARRIRIRAATCTGGSLGGPIVRNKFFFFGNFGNRPRARGREPQLPGQCGAAGHVVLDDHRLHRARTHFLRFDYQLNQNNQFSFRWVRERILTVNDSIEDNQSILDNATNENDAGDYRAQLRPGHRSSTTARPTR